MKETGEINNINKLVLDIFENEMTDIFGNPSKIVSEITTSENGTIIINLPRWVGSALVPKVGTQVYKSLSLGNLFGAVMIMFQDKIIDAAHFDRNDFPLKIIISNRLYYKWLNEYQKIFRSDNLFWVLFEKYLNEFTSASLWERNKYKKYPPEYSETDLINYGYKFSLLKISAAGICINANKKEDINNYSKIIEHYHTGYQLYDDLKDWEEDLNNRNYTYLLSEINYRLNDLSDKPAINNFLNSGNFIENYLSKSDTYYNFALKQAREISCDGIIKFIENKLNSNRILLGKYKAIKTITVTQIPSFHIQRLIDVHFFTHHNQHYLLDIHRNATMKISGEMYYVLKTIHNNDSTLDPALKKQLSSKCTDINSILIELGNVGLLRTEQLQANDSTPKKKDGELIASLGILLSTRVDEKTEICELNTIKKGIDFLFIMAGYWSQLTLHFFIEDSISAKTVSLIDEGLSYAERLSKKLFKSITFTINIPYSLLKNKSALAKMINLSNYSSHIFVNVSFASGEYLSNPVKKRADEEFPSNCIFNTDTECYPRTIPLEDYLSKSKNDMDVYFSTLYSKKLQKRLTLYKNHNYFCNAGKSYVVLDANGYFYPCHLFAKERKNRMGHVSEKLQDQEKYINIDHDNNGKCSACWSRNICGKGCIYIKGKVRDDEFQQSFCIPFKQFTEKAIINKFNSGKINKKTFMRINMVPCDYF